MTIRARKAFAPSRNLLKFLRAQNEGFPFFTPNRDISRQCTDVRNSISQPAFATGRPPATRSMTTACIPIIGPIESSFGGVLDNLWIRKSRTALSKQSLFATPTQPTAAPAALVERQCPTKYLSRPASTTPGRHVQDRGLGRLWGFKKSRTRAALQPDDLPPITGFLDDHTSLGRTMRPGNELKLRCTEFDGNGNVTLVNGEFKKSELIAKYGLLPRDLRKIDSSFLPNILVRPSAILINLLHLRVLIKHDRVLVLDAYGTTDSYTQSLFMYDLEGKLRTPEARTTSVGALPYEFRALEAVLISVTTGLEAEFEGVREPVLRVLRELEEDIDRDKLRHLLIYSKKLGTFEQKARLVRDAIDDLLEADDDLAALYLTEKAQGSARSENDHTEIEMLLESYHKVCDEIVQVSGNLVSNIRNTEEIVRAILDANRNSLMLLDLKFSIGTLALGGGTFVAALYGMNLKNFIEESDFGFWGVSIWSTVLTIIVGIWGLRVLRRVQRLTMWGSTGGGRTQGRSGWTKLGRGDTTDPKLVDSPPSPSEPLMGMLRRERLRGSRESKTMEHAEHTPWKQHDESISPPQVSHPPRPMLKTYPPQLHVKPRK